MKVLIVGGTGFIGSHVTRQLLDAGHDVLNFHRGLQHLDLPKPPLLEILGDRKDLESFRRDFEQFGPEVVVDMIPMTENDARSLMITFTGIAKRLVVISSADVYRNYELLHGLVSAEPCPGSITESSPLREHLFPYRAQARDSSDVFYNYEKILVERVVTSSPDLPATVLRLPCVYGPGDSKHRLFPYLKRMDDQRPAILLEKGQVLWRWTRGYVENVAAAICWGLGDQSAISRIYNVGEPYGLSEKAWIQSIGDSAGWTGKIIGLEPAGLPKAMRSGLAWEHQLETDTSLIRSQSRFSEPVPYREGLNRTIAWERENPPIKVNPQDFDYEMEDRVLALLAL